LEPLKILHEHNLKRTSCREGILEVIIQAGHALSEQEIRSRLKGHYDRTTFYRSFKTLQECHIIHKIVIDNQLVKYALNNSITSRKHHAHFYCEKCDRVICMENVPVDTPELPEGYTINDAELIIKGLCRKCKS